MTKNVTAESFFAQKDKQLHMGAGYAVALTTNLLITQIGVVRVDGQPLSALEKAWWCTLASFGVGALYEFYQTLGNTTVRADPNDILATGLGGAAAGLFTIVIDF